MADDGEGRSETNGEEVEAQRLESCRKTAELRKLIDIVSRNGVELVRDSNGLPKIGGDYEMLNSYPTYNEFMKRQEDRLNILMSRLTKSIGCPMRVPNPGASTQEYTECVVEAQDNIAERASTLLEVLKKAERDEVVQVPEYILKAAPTNKKAEVDSFSAMRTFSANIGSILAQKFRERKEEAAQMIVNEKPQKSYNLNMDNSFAPFVSKLKIKHHSIEKRKGIIIIDEDVSGRVEWTSNSEEIEEEHPYIGEVLHFKVPTKQLQSATPLKYETLQNTPLTMVDTVEKLEKLRDVLNSVDEFAVDLEHNETRSYLGLTCLIQISTRNEDFIVDPFPIWENVGILNEPFANPNILKVFHGSDNDVLWLQRDFGIHIVNLFDTYVAMKKLKYPKFGLAYLVSRIASVPLDKQYQLADWRARPLRNAMINYAREDTHYLLFCYDTLREQLLKQAEVDLKDVYQESSNLCVKVYKKPSFNAKGYMTEIKFRFTLNSRQDYALTHLYKWRDLIARDEDESPHFVLPNHMLLALAETLPRDVGGIYACCNPLPSYIKQRTGDVLKIILEARDVKLEKKDPTLKEIDDAHESRGVMNDTMDMITVVLRSKIDFSHTQFDEERGEIEINKNEESDEVVKKSEDLTLLSVLQPAKTSDIAGNVVVVQQGPKLNSKKCNEIVKKLEEWVTPFECYTIVMKERQKREEAERIEEEKMKAEENAAGAPKTKFSHLDQTVCRKPVFDDEATKGSELKLAASQDDTEETNEKEASTEKQSDEPAVFDSSRFAEDQLMSKRSLKRKQKEARRNVDISTVLGEPTSTTQKTGEESSSKKPKIEEVEEFDYEAEDISQFEQPAKGAGNDEFDPFHQKYRLKNKSKKQVIRKSANRTGTINYNKKK